MKEETHIPWCLWTTAMPKDSRLLSRCLAVNQGLWFATGVGTVTQPRPSTAAGSVLTTTAGLSRDFEVCPPAHPQRTELLSPFEFLFSPRILKNWWEQNTSFKAGPERALLCCVLARNQPALGFSEGERLGPKLAAYGPRRPGLC